MLYFFALKRPYRKTVSEINEILALLLNSRGSASQGMVFAWQRCAELDVLTKAPQHEHTCQCYASASTACEAISSISMGLLFRFLLSRLHLTKRATVFLLNAVTRLPRVQVCVKGIRLA